jgi:1-acyl-sn-glycerol-3-phosphate acyltransferase
MLGITWCKNTILGIRGLIRNPEPFYRFCARIIIRVLYRTRFEGFEALPAEGGAVLISNHVSYVDGLILNAASKRKVRFVIDDVIYRIPAVNYFMKLDRAIPIAPNRESVSRALDEIEAGLKGGDLICIFPEGQLTYTGNMTRFRFGIEWIIKRAPVDVYPIALKGLWGSAFSRKYRHARFPMLPRSFRRRVWAKVGERISPEKVKVSNLQRIVMDLKNSIQMPGA